MDEHKVGTVSSGSVQEAKLQNEGEQCKKEKQRNMQEIFSQARTDIHYANVKRFRPSSSEKCIPYLWGFQR